MSTTFKELKRQVMLRMQNADGRTQLAVEQAVNDAIRVIVTVHDFDDLMVTDTSNAVTVANQANYHVENDFLLTRPKDIYSIRYMDEDNSRKLTYVPSRDVDVVLPYTDILGTDRPSFYTRRGMYIELIPIPNANANLYIQHSQWPATLSNETDECPLVNIDPAIVALATDIAFSILDGHSGDWFQRAKQLLGIVVSDDDAKPDVWKVAKPFSAEQRSIEGEYWNNPFIRRVS